MTQLAQLRAEGKVIKVMVGTETIATFPQAQLSDAMTAANAHNEALLATATAPKSTVTSTVRCQLTYRGEFRVIPRGDSNPAITTTADVMEALIADWPTISATFEANRSRVAANYASKGKSLGMEQAKLQPKINLDLVKA